MIPSPTDPNSATKIYRPPESNTQSEDDQIDNLASQSLSRSSSGEPPKLEGKKFTDLTETIDEIGPANKSKTRKVKDIFSKVISKLKGIVKSIFTKLQRTTPQGEINSTEKSFVAQGTTAKDTSYNIVTNNVGEIVPTEKSFVAQGTTAKDTSYNIVTNNEGQAIDGNADICHINPALRLMYIVDGSGHNDPIMKRDLEEVFGRFNPGYEEAIANNKFETVEEAQEFVSQQMNRLHDIIREIAREAATNRRGGEENPIGMSFIDNVEFDFDAGKLPAMSFAQVVTIEGKNYLLSAQFGDTSLVIQRATGEISFLLVNTSENVPLGQNRINPTNVHVTTLHSGDRIIGCSDGIMEFITKSDFASVVRQNRDSDAEDLLKKFRQLVIAKGEQFAAEFEAATPEEQEKLKNDRDPRNRQAILGANKRVIKMHDWENPGKHDDLSLAVMTVT